MMKAYEYLANAMHSGNQEVLEAARVKIRNELAKQCSTKEQFDNAWDTIARKALSRCRGSKPALIESMQDSVYNQEQRRLQGQPVRVPKIVRTQPKIYEPEPEPEYEVVETINGVPNTWANAFGMLFVVLVILVVTSIFYEPGKDDGYADSSYKSKVHITAQKGYVLRKKH